VRGIFHALDSRVQSPRATVLSAMSRSWVALTVLTERYTAILNEEEERPAN
jgi:hypothetical protein